MLEHIHIQNIGLVEEVSIDFCKNITMFSGETGAGKSMLLSSVLLLMGGKTNKNTVRSGASQANVSSEWNIANNSEVKKWLAQKDIECEGDVIQLRRSIKTNGRSQCFIEGVPFTLKEMGECMNLMCEVHAQHEHQKLFNINVQLRIIDRFAGINDRVDDFTQRLTAYKKKEKMFLQSVQDEETRLRDIDYLEFAVQEIEGAKIQKNEDETLSDELNRASNMEHIMELWKQLDALLMGDGGASDMLKDVAHVLSDLDDLQTDLSELNERLSSARIEIDDIAYTLKQREENLVYLEPDKLQKIESRLSLLEGLKKKYGGTLEHVLEFKEQSEEKLEMLKNYDKDKSKLEEELKFEKKALVQEAREISEIRKKEAETFAEEVNQILQRLAMSAANFYIHFHENNSINAQGIDKIEFYISSNKGEKHYPLAQIASGGEMSRIMLAIKVVSSKKDSLETLLLDEVDAGIGGNTARVLGEYLYQLGTNTQIICVSHLPVIVAAAHVHFKVDKQEMDDRTKIFVSKLNDDERILELARMISGQPREATAQNQAREFLKLYGGRVF